MAAAAFASELKSPIEQINDTLRGSVIDVLRDLIPTLAPYTNEEAFNVILNSPEMTARVFRCFRENPEAFSHLLLNEEDQPVSNDNEKLSCGRSLAQVVALVVQAVAKRYFRAKIGLRMTGNLRAAQPEPGLVDKIVSMLKPAQPQKTVKKVHPSDRLFNAMRDYLLFDWQLRLIPHYVGLPVPLVNSLGARLLDYREIEDIQWMVRTGVPLSKPSGTPAPVIPFLRAVEPTVAEPPAPDVAAPVAVAGPAPRPPEAAVMPAIKLPEGVDQQKFVAAVLGRVNPPLAKRLLRDLGLNARQLAVMLVRAYEVMPSSEFQRFGAAPPDSPEANRFIAAALTARFGVNTDPATSTEFVRLYLANVRAAT